VKRKILSTILAVIIAGCATSANYEKVLNTWVGSNADQLVQTWGPPQRTYNLSDGGVVLEYMKSRNAQVGGYSYSQPQTSYYSGTASALGPGGSVYGTYAGSSTTMVQKTTPVYNVNLWCKTIFNTDDTGKIIDWKFEGNNCKTLLPDGLREDNFIEKKVETLILSEGALVPLKSRPDSYGALVKTLLENDELKILGVKSGWLKVETLDGEKGWVEEKDLHRKY